MLLVLRVLLYTCYLSQKLPAVLLHLCYCECKITTLCITCKISLYGETTAELFGIIKYCWVWTRSEEKKRKQKDIEINITFKHTTAYVNKVFSKMISHQCCSQCIFICKVQRSFWQTAKTCSHRCSTAHVFIRAVDTTVILCKWWVKVPTWNLTRDISSH